MVAGGLQGTNFQKLEDAFALDTFALSRTFSVVPIGFVVLRGSPTIERRNHCPLIGLRPVFRHLQAPEALSSLYGFEEGGIGIDPCRDDSRSHARSVLHSGSADLRVVHKVS